jgi:hypothetical protein
MPGSRTQIAQVDVTAGIQLLLGTACGFLIASLYDARVTGLGTALPLFALPRLPPSLCKALRSAATSGRSCSAACRLFLKGHLRMTKKSENRRLADFYLRLC